MGRKRRWSKFSAAEKRIVAWAYFFRYGYWLLWPATGAVIRDARVPFAVFALYGALALLGLATDSRILYCAMQDAGHEKMTPGRRGLRTDMRRDALFSGLFFLILGLAGLVVQALEKTPT